MQKENIPVKFYIVSAANTNSTSGSYISEHLLKKLRKYYKGIIPVKTKLATLKFPALAKTAQIL